MTDDSGIVESWPERDDLRARVLELFGAFSNVQEWLMFAVEFYLQKTSPAVGSWVKGRYLDKVNDLDRLEWFGAVVADSGVDGVPLHKIREVVDDAKEIRDHIAHSPGVAPIGPIPAGAFTFLTGKPEGR